MCAIVPYFIPMELANVNKNATKLYIIQIGKTEVTDCP